MEITLAKEIVNQFDLGFLADLRGGGYVSGTGTDGESIIVYLIKELPEDVVLPSTFHSLPIICRVSGETSAGPAEVPKNTSKEILICIPKDTGIVKDDSRSRAETIKLFTEFMSDLADRIFARFPEVEVVGHTMLHVSVQVPFGSRELWKQKIESEFDCNVGFGSTQMQLFHP